MITESPTRSDSTHPTQDELVFFADAKLDDEGIDIIQRHLDVCDACAEEVAELKSAGVVTGPAVKTRSRSRRGWVPGAIGAVVVVAFVLWRGINPVQPHAAGTPPPAAATGTETFALTPEESRVIADALESGHLSLPADFAALQSADEARGTNPARAEQLEAHMQAQPLHLAVLLAHLGLTGRAEQYLDKAAADARHPTAQSPRGGDPASHPSANASTVKLIEDLRRSLAAARGQTAPSLPGSPTQ